MALGLGLPSLGRVEVRAVLGHVLHVVDLLAVPRRGRVLGSLVGLVERLMKSCEVDHLLTTIINIGIVVVVALCVSTLVLHPRKSTKGLQLRLLRVDDCEGVDTSADVSSLEVVAPRNVFTPLIVLVLVALI